MRRVLLTVVTLALLGSIAVPVVLLRRADEREAEADLRNASFVLADAPTGVLVGRLLSARRVPRTLTAQAAVERMVDVVADFDVQLPPESCLAVSLDGVEMGELRPDAALIPASTMKLLTAVSAVEVLGRDDRLVTELRSDAVPGPDGVLDGDVWLVGGGDPLLYTPAYAAAFSHQPQVRTEVERLADLVAALGINRITGALIGDDSRYDRVRYVPSWPSRYITQNNSGPLSALSVDDGFSAFDPTLVHADDPARWAAEAVTAIFAERGITVDGPAASGTAPDTAATLAVLESMPMEGIVAQMLRESDNNTAELLLKEVGLRLEATGSTEAGARGVADALVRLGFDIDGSVLVDGSGLDRSNRATCGLLRDLLDRAGPGSALADGLAVAGATGTLTNRFDDLDVAGRVRAKTGFLNEVNGLAGFVDGSDGHVITFAIITNGIPVDSRRGFEIQDLLIEELVDEPVVPAVAELSMADA